MLERRRAPLARLARSGPLVLRRRVLSEIDISGVYVAPIAVYGAAALPIALGPRWVLRRTALGTRWILWRTRILPLFRYQSFVTLTLYVATLTLLILYA